MDPAAEPVQPADPIAALPPKPSGWGVSLLLGILLMVVYMASRLDPVGTEDTTPNSLLPMALARGDGPYVERFNTVLTGFGRKPVSWSMKPYFGHVVSRYSIGPAFVALPFVAIQLAVLDRIDPGWDKNPGKAYLRAHRTAKIAWSLIAALTGVALHRLLWRLGVGWMAIPATLAAMLGSDFWVVASQAPWEHGPAAFMLTLAMVLLTPRPVSRVRLVLAGLATGMVVCCRSLDLIFAIALLLAVAFERPRSLLWFLPGPILLGVALITYNYWFFQSIIGGLVELESLHGIRHHQTGTWSGQLLSGLAGTLLSPNRGLFVFCSWVPVTLMALPATARRVRAWPLGIWVSGALLVNLLVLSKYSVWWAGHTFGPRYWIDATPILAVYLAFALEWAWARCRPLVAVYALTIIVSPCG
jgi:hypothetical protein